MIITTTQFRKREVKNFKTSLDPYIDFLMNLNDLTVEMSLKKNKIKPCIPAITRRKFNV